MRALPQDLEAKIDEIKGWMFYGDQALVAKKARTWETRVSEVLNKKRAPSKQILDAAVEVMNENKARFECTPKLKIA